MNPELEAWEDDELISELADRGYKPLYTNSKLLFLTATQLTCIANEINTALPGVKMGNWKWWSKR